MRRFNGRWLRVKAPGGQRRFAGDLWRGGLLLAAGLQLGAANAADLEAPLVAVGGAVVPVGEVVEFVDVGLA
ncbi:hypothetical protein ITJ42_15745 [Clavibacter michiganensis subsp. phaseoli]|uniref:Uncharacterized protein n=1 Tax=Clavibacter phaseoli TaxID=1734031 RepID=A0A8I0VDL3_9MICO|nr:hypothetical protein [Clavibacter phaseoli]MBF4632672.1 hypothetical protein [Clavibacter phaseoli]